MYNCINNCEIVILTFLDPPPKLPYYVRRKRDHTLPLYLSRRRDLLNEETLDFDYVELVTMKGVEGDVFVRPPSLFPYMSMNPSFASVLPV